MGHLQTINMPDIGEGIAEGEIIKWLKNTNDHVAKNEPIVVVMTDKASVELSSPYEGKIARVFYKEGELAICHTPLYTIEQPTSEICTNTNALSTHLGKSSLPFVEKKQEERILATPFVRHLAHNLNVDLTQIQRTGKEGAITEEDVRRGATTSSTSPESHTVSLTGIPLAMAKKMRESYEQIPHFSYFEKVDASKLIRLKEEIQYALSTHQTRVTYVPFFIRALSLTIQQYPAINSWFNYKENKWIIHKQQHVGIAVAANDGLIVPVLKDVQEMNLFTIIQKYEELKQKALKGQLAPEEMKKSTITLSNFSTRGSGAQWATPIINFPEVAILAIAKIHKQPFIENNQVVVHDALNLSWSFNHCVIDGEMAAAVSYHYNKLISDPTSLA